MKKFFHKPSKVALVSLVATFGVLVILFSVLNMQGPYTEIGMMIGKITIMISLPFLILNPIFGFIYSFFVEGKIKYLYLLLHVASICTISLGSFVAFMFRYFVPFAP